MDSESVHGSGVSPASPSLLLSLPLTSIPPLIPLSLSPLSLPPSHYPQTSGRTTKLSDISNEVTQLLQTQCSCVPRVQEAEFYCFPDTEQYVTFRGQLYAPLTVRVDTLLTHLEDWVRGGASIRVNEYKTIDADCEPAIATVEDMECEAPTQPSEETPKTSSPASMVEEMSSGVSVVVLGGVAVGSFVLGMAAMLVLLALCYMIKKW